jgi:DNA-binding transcriptional regulator YhcF (GntR family)
LILAKILQLNPNTVAKAYYNLEHEGLLECKGRKGSYVNYDKTRLDRLSNVIAEDELKIFLEKIFYLGISEDELKKMIARQFERNHFK